MMPAFSSLMAPQIVKATTWGGTSDNKVDIMTILGFQRGMKTAMLSKPHHS